MNKAGIMCTGIVMLGILFLTLQSSTDTMKLSNGVLELFHRCNLNITNDQLRAGVHIPLYFPLGLAFCLFIQYEKAIVFGSLIGLGDETLKIFLPTRHFSSLDLVLDIVGVILGALMLWIFRK